MSARHYANNTNEQRSFEPLQVSDNSRTPHFVAIELISAIVMLIREVISHNNL